MPTAPSRCLSPALKIEDFSTYWVITAQGIPTEADPREEHAAEMADIALLVAEEYERMKRWHKGEVEGLNCALSSYFSSLGKKKEAEGRKEEKVVVVVAGVGLRKALEPRTPLGLAAMEGFFPA